MPGRNNNTPGVHREATMLRIAGILFIMFLAGLAGWWATDPYASAQTTTPGVIQQAAAGTTTTPLLALTGACTALVGAIGVVIRAFVKGDIAPRSDAVREEELLKQNAVLARLLEDAAKREDIFYKYIGIIPAQGHE